MKAPITKPAALYRLCIICVLMFFFSNCKKTEDAKPLAANSADNIALAVTVTAPYDCSNLVNALTTLPADVTVVKDVSYSNGTYIPDVAYGMDSLGNCAPTHLKDTVINGASVLKYDVYYLASTKYSYQRLPPALVLFHAGGFSDCSNKDADGMSTYCQQFARRGFVVFNVEYRRGRLKDPANDVNGNMPNTASQTLAMYRAFQDGRGALKSIIQDNIATSAYRFDNNNVFIGGASAGAYIALNVAYFSTQAMIDQVFPDARKVLGLINANHYKGATTLRPVIRGVLNMWGGLHYPVNTDPAVFFAQNVRNPPMIAFGGNKDPVIPTGISEVYYSSGALNTDSIANGYVFSQDNDATPDIMEFGASGLYDFLKTRLQIPAELYVDCPMGHGLDNKSNFGTGILNNKDSVRMYQAQRGATFFQAVLNNAAASFNTVKFVDCENFRNGCSTADNNNGCSNSYTCNN